MKIVTVPSSALNALLPGASRFPSVLMVAEAGQSIPARAAAFLSERGRPTTAAEFADALAKAAS